MLAAIAPGLVPGDRSGVAEHSPLTLPLPDRLTLGLFAYRPAEVLKPQWQPLIDYLNRELPSGVPRLSLRILDQDQLHLALQAGELDFVFTNPAHYVRLRSSSNLSGALATLIALREGRTVTQLGGVLISRDTAGAPQHIEDLRRARIAIAGRQFLGGFAAPAMALRAAGIDPLHLDYLEVGRSHDAVVRAVLEGRAEAGFIRTGILEQLAREGRLPVHELRVIAERSHPGFPFRVSTALYPEWAFVSLDNVPADFAKRVAALLFSLSSEHPAAQAAGIAGFTIPADYTPVADAMLSLRLPPFDVPPEFDWGDVWQRYQKLIVSGFLLLLIMAGLAVALAFSNLRQRQLRVQAEQMRRRMQQANERERLLATVFEASREGIAITDAEQRFVEINSTFSQLSGYSLEEIRGQQPLLLFAEPPSELQLARIQQQLVDTGAWVGEGPVRRRDGSILPVEFSVVAVRDVGGEPRHYAVVMDDITERKAHEHELERSAHYDPLTGIPNRRLFMDRLGQALAHARRSGEQPALAMLDLDGFKPVNDRYGHEAGDQVLVEVARRLQALLRAEDTVARIGGDEFVLLLRHPDGEAVWGRILAAVRRPVLLAEGEVRVGASIGIAIFDAERFAAEDSAGEALLRQADSAMYSAKSQGRNRYTVYSTLSIRNAWRAPGQ